MKQLMAANWKMYKTWNQARDTASELAQNIRGQLPENREVLIFPPFTALKGVAEALQNEPGMAAGAQNMYPAAEGAFTGEISPDMLLDVGASWVLTGHSERRHVLGEDNAFVGRKTAFALNNNLNVILCIGELIEERRADRVEEVLSEQLEAGLAEIPVGLTSDSLVIAYEPVWAIGTGEVAGPDEIATTHTFVRKKIEELLPSIASEISILYGGSVKPDNISAIMTLDNVDGVLVGGASLTAESFSKIVLA
ncbi:triosephosphate isomerase [Paucidesulfovibrio gracilis DSM 16080]|uniref:Triosephosphate isomerase n=1 Tax=Paucidesulfovibrio gracilis DSM 16080 TaxID=1121449 RepID=A0A1T4WNI2_9BACT|nr:triose-phosphate isomerase [Paucidesulfovibrio gracilis]SKA78912.1 triosephosphate isomerase [Paucidesulfovibrio gracilis DSM 16080]